MHHYIVIDFNHRDAWVESLAIELAKESSPVTLLSLSRPGEIHRSLLGNFMGNSRALTLKSMLLLIREAYGEKFKNSEFLINAHGHRSAIFATLVSYFVPCKIVIFHHMSPDFFSLAKLFKKNFDFTSQIHSFLVKRYIKRAFSHVVFSTSTKNKLIDLGVGIAQISHIPFGVDLGKYAMTSKNRTVLHDSKTCKFIMVGRLSWEKNYEFALSIFSHWKKLDFDFKVDIFGQGPLELHLKNLIIDLDLTEYVEFCGHSNEINQIYPNYEALLHFSQFETYGQVLVEALLSGLEVYCPLVGVVEDLSSFEFEKMFILTSDSSKLVARDILIHHKSAFKNYNDGSTDLAKLSNHDKQASLKQFVALLTSFSF
jgi:glycosyltransferase involved in cell wall biosynthesis